MEKSVNIEDNLEKASTIRGLDPDVGSFTQGIDKEIFTGEKGVDIDTLYNVLKKSPEVMGVVSAIIEDIMADQWRFDGSKNAVKKAKLFQLQSNFFKVMTNALFDLLVTGNAYILKLSVPEKEMEDLINEVTLDVLKEMEASMMNDTGKTLKESVFEIVEQKKEKTNDLQLLKSSTIKINADDTGRVRSYQQSVGGSERIYKSEDIIHLSLVNVGGGVYGITPLEPLLSDIATLIFAKEYAGKFFENDGMPNWMLTMPDATPDDRNYKGIKQAIKDLQKKQNKFRAMVVTGNVQAQQIEKFNKDLQFTELIKHFTQIILIAFGVPPARVNWTATADKAVTGGGTAKELEGYYKKISFIQKNLENQLNKELWMSKTVTMVFNRGYKIDEMREAQIVQILTQVGAVTIEEAREMMGKERELPEGLMGNKTGDDNRADFRQDRNEEQGREEEPQPPIDNKVKSITKGLEGLEVGFEDFVRLVERVAPFDNANILYIETADEFTLYWTDQHWKYICKVSKKDLDVEAFRIEKLSRAIKVRV
jgi:HK97 family phage portal protein